MNRHLDELKRKARRLNAELGRTLKEIEHLEEPCDVWEPEEVPDEQPVLIEA